MGVYSRLSERLIRDGRDLILDNLGVGFKETVCILLGDAQGREEADYICAAYSGEYVLLKEQTLADFLDGLLKLHAYHKAATANLLGAGNCLKLLQQV